MQLMVFSKHLQGPPLGETARRLRAMEIDAIDLTVRPGGHVEPEQVEEQLPLAFESLREHGVSIGMVTTNITDASDPLTEKVLRTAARLGVGYYKLGYYAYEGFGTLRRARADARARVADLAVLNQEIGIVGGYHNHSNTFIGASLWDIDYILEGTAPTAVGLYLDLAHATVEGGARGWTQGMDLMRERIVMLAVKDFHWIAGPGYAGGRANHPSWCPLEDGTVAWPEALKYLRQIGFDGPVSLHSEYQGAHSFRDLSTDEVFEQTARDARVFREWMAQA